MIKYIDTHAHLQSDRYRQDLRRVLDRAREGGVERVINVGIDLESSRQAVSMAGSGSPALSAAVGIHPHNAAKGTEPDYRELARMSRQPEVVALGEMGLDYYRDLSPRKAQRRSFSRQLGLAQDLDLPIIVHNRDAAQDVYNLLKQDGQGLDGVLHCFSDDWSWADRFLDLGFYLSLAGPVTYVNARDAREVAERVPLDRLLVETDCPYLAPHPHRGRRNEPAWVALVVAEIARIRDMSVSEVAELTFDNAERLFGLVRKE